MKPQSSAPQPARLPASPHFCSCRVPAVLPARLSDPLALTNDRLENRETGPYILRDIYVVMH